MNLDDCTVYVFVRQDLPIEQQLVQSVHAAFHAGMDFAARHGAHPGIPFTVLIGLPHAKSLRKTARKLIDNLVDCHIFTDTDISSDATAIATYPLNAEEKQVLSEYRKLWRYSPDTPAQGIGLNADRGASLESSRSSVETEHRTFSPEVDGSIPSVSSSLPCE